MTRRTKFVATLALAAGLSLAAAPRAVLAQANSDQFAGTNEEESKGEGRTLDGYIITGMLAGLVLFIVGKSARR